MTLTKKEWMEKKYLQQLDVIQDCIIEMGSQLMEMDKRIKELESVNPYSKGYPEGFLDKNALHK